MSKDETVGFLERVLARYESDGFGIEALIDRASGTMIGWAGLAVPHFLPEILPAVEVGWRLSGPWRGRGLATEAGAAAVEFGFTDGRPRAHRQHLRAGERRVGPGHGTPRLHALAHDHGAPRRRGRRHGADAGRAGRTAVGDIERQTAVEPVGRRPLHRDGARRLGDLGTRAAGTWRRSPCAPRGRRATSPARPASSVTTSRWPRSHRSISWSPRCDRAAPCWRSESP